MGYSHYWAMPDEDFSDEVIRDLEHVLKRNKDIIQRDFDTNNAYEPTLEDDLIVFNGIGEQGHETFYLQRAVKGFCKTNEKPYDIAVCEALLVLKHHYGNEFELGSDGFYVNRNGLENRVLDGKWNEAIRNVNEQFGYEFELIPKTERSGGFEYYSFDVLSSDEHKEKLLEDKKALLLVEKSIELNFGIVAEQEDENGNLHVLCRRESDRSHVVWTSYNTGEVKTSYENLYNGKYDMNREEGLKELDSRAGVDVINFLEYEFDGSYEGENYHEFTTHTSGGVEIGLHLSKDVNFDGSLEKQFDEYVNSFNVDEAIDVFRLNDEYKKAFTIRESLEDFSEYEKWLEDVNDRLKAKLDKHKNKNISKDKQNNNEYER